MELKKNWSLGRERSGDPPPVADRGFLRQVIPILEGAHKTVMLQIFHLLKLKELGSAPICVN